MGTIHCSKRITKNGCIIVTRCQDDKRRRITVCPRMNFAAPRPRGATDTNCDCWRARMPAQPERCNPSARCISPKMLVLATLALLRCAASGHLEFNGTGVAFAAMFTDHSTTADHAVLQRSPEQGTTSAAPFTDAGTKIVPIKTTDEAPDKCEPPMRSAVGPGTQAQQQAFQKCCETMSASATCFATPI